ncbi:MAG: OmpA family protein [Saprospiraceae bacterium]|nr:OmpA family protein [Saprospiraceae bacterium]
MRLRLTTYFLLLIGVSLSYGQSTAVPPDTTAVDSFKAGRTPLLEEDTQTDIEVVPQKDEMQSAPVQSEPTQNSQLIIQNDQNANNPLGTITLDTSKNNAQANDPNSLWKSGKSKYPPKPKHMWEIGLGVGNYFISGDVDYCLPGYGFALHVRRALHYAFSIRAEVFYGIAYGLEPQPYSSSLDNEQEVFQGYGTNSGGNAWFPSYRTKYLSASLQGVLNIGNILFHKDRNVWNWYMFVGLGLDHHVTELDLKDEYGVYTNLVGITNFTVDRFNTSKGRSEIKDKLESIYDGKYETRAHEQNGIFRFGDDYNSHVLFQAGIGLARKINRRINIAIEHQIGLTDNDYLDGIRWRTNLDQTTENDVQHFTNLRLAINIGSFKKKKEPLYWLNPLDAVMQDIADLKQRPVYDPTDTDKDGVIDLLDQDNETPEGAAVDTKGLALDSDNDGIPDYKDAEPFSPPGIAVDERGVAKVNPPLGEGDVKNIIDKRFGIPPGTADGDAAHVLLSNVKWFLPMVHFNLDEYCINEKYAPQFANVAQVMKTHPGLKITVHGHTDIRHSNAYNKVLSYNRAHEAIEYMVNTYCIARDRFILMYGGEEQPLGGHKVNHGVNRRAEFRVAAPDDIEMPKPDGPPAGQCHKKRKAKSSSTENNEGGSGEEKKSGF